MVMLYEGVRRIVRKPEEQDKDGGTKSRLGGGAKYIDTVGIQVRLSRLD